MFIRPGEQHFWRNSDKMSGGVWSMNREIYPPPLAAPLNLALLTVVPVECSLTRVGEEAQPALLQIRLQGVGRSFLVRHRSTAKGQRQGTVDGECPPLRMLNGPVRDPPLS